LKAAGLADDDADDPLDYAFQSCPIKMGWHCGNSGESSGIGGARQVQVAIVATVKLPIGPVQQCVSAKLRSGGSGA
jgi:hypothetical protein